MRKKLIVFVIVMIMLLSVILTGCKSEPKVIVYLGDSIAEGIAGISPLNERERYAYYGVLGIRNEYIYKNRAVSGHLTKSLLAVIKEEDTDVKAIRTTLKNADIIHISILGNDILFKLGEVVVAAAKEDYDYINDVLKESKGYFDEVITTLRSYNNDAVIMIQTLYNPIFENTILINSEIRSELLELGVEDSELRALGNIVINMLNAVITDYLAAHPNEYYVIDAKAEFDRIYAENPERGKALVFVDCIHPSDEGHAVLADLTQAKLEELNLADKSSAVKKYKELRNEQLGRMFKDTVDVKAVSKQINNADSCEEITRIYFEAIKDKVPAYC